MNEFKLTCQSAPYPNTLTSFGGDVHVPYGYVPDLSPSHDLKANLVPEEMDSTIPKMLGHPPSASSSGYSGSATSDLIPTYPLPTDDFTHYVDMSPSATPVGAAGASAARDPPQYGGAQLGLYVPGVDPTLAVGVGYGAKPMAGSDLRVAYDRPVAGMQFKRELQQV
jgi:hypothetical protein